MHTSELMLMPHNSERHTRDLKVYPVDTNGLSHGPGHGGQQLPASMARLNWRPCLTTSCFIQQQSQAIWILLF